MSVNPVKEELLVVVDPTSYGVEPSKAQELIGNLPQITQERDQMADQYDEVVRMNIEDPKTMKLAKELRLRLRKNRTQGINVWHRTTKNFFLKGGQFVDAIKNREAAINERMEAGLEEIEKHLETLEKIHIQNLQDERTEMLKKFVEDTSNLQLGTMDDDVFEAYYTAKMQAFYDDAAAKLQANIDRVAKEEAEAKAREIQRVENMRLRKEAEEKEAELQAERKKQAEVLAEQKAKAKAKEDKLRAANQKKLDKEKAVRLKLEAELMSKRIAEAKAKDEKLAEAKAEAERIAIAEAEAEELAKAPVREQLNAWVDSFELPESPLDNEVTAVIYRNFEVFKDRAKVQVSLM
jgi:colicin import membrane protein